MVHNTYAEVLGGKQEEKELPDQKRMKGGLRGGRPS